MTCDLERAETLQLAVRPPGAVTGSEFIERTSRLSRGEREAAILDAVLAGNVPDFLRTFCKVSVSMLSDDGQLHSGVVYVAPDYLAIGSDDDFIRIPMGLPTARAIAERVACTLPTKKLVDLIWAQAQVKLVPQPMRAGGRMMSNAYFLEHQLRIERQRAGKPLGVLTAGHKKDLVITNRLRSHPGRVAIYGWHLPNGSPIQPLSTKHEATYADYSHGVRLVSATMQVDGSDALIADVLRDPSLSDLVSDEGIITIS